MSDRYQSDEAFEARGRDVSRQAPPLPSWLANRLLKEDEKVNWVYGPRFNPWWERYVTHPALFLVALAAGAISFGVGWLLSEDRTELPLLPVLAAGSIIIGSILVLGIANGYFTRLVVTDLRIVILQGYEVCRSWSLDDLPRSLIRFSWREGEEEERQSVDLGALQTMLGTASDQIVDAKTILKFGKSIEQIRTRKDGRRP
jgi:hypothetical protein